MTDPDKGRRMPEWSMVVPPRTTLEQRVAGWILIGPRLVAMGLLWVTWTWTRSAAALLVWTALVLALFQL